MCVDPRVRTTTESEMLIPAVILAGGEDSTTILGKMGAPHRALAEVAGRPAVEWVAHALRAVDEVGELALVGAPAVLDAGVGRFADHPVPADGDLVDNIEAGLRALPASEVALIVTADLPLLSGAAVADFLAQSTRSAADLTYPIIPKEACEARFPGARRTYVKLREGTFTGGNAVLFKRDFIARHGSLVRSLYAARKRPWRLAGMLGMGFALRLLAGELSLQQVERRAGEILHGTARAIISRFPELGFDVDRPEDLEAARRAKAQPA